MRPLAHVVLANAVCLLPAQEPGAPGIAPKQPPVLVDTVVATVNDAAIMLSTLRTATAGRIDAIEAQLDRKLRPPEVMSLLSQALDYEVDRHSLAQSAKSFGIATPEQVEQLFADEMKREEAEQVRDLGTYQEFSRELQREGRTWQTYWREKRVEKMAEFAKDFAIRMRMQKQRNLYLTPKMLRETYRREIGRFIRGAEAELSILVFRGTDAERHARAAAATWALQDLAPAQLVEKAKAAGALATALPPLRGIREGSRAELAEELVDFALAGPLGQVSPPLAIGGGFHVAKVTAFSAARDGRFEDAEVQLELRAICLESVIGEFTKQALDRASDRTEVWRAKLFR